MVRTPRLACVIGSCDILFEGLSFKKALKDSNHFDI